MDGATRTSWHIRLDINLDNCTEEECEDFQDRINNHLIDDLMRDSEYEVRAYEMGHGPIEAPQALAVTGES